MTKKWVPLSRVVFASMLFLAGVVDQAWSQVDDPAIVMVKTLGLGANLSSMSFSAAMMTQTYQGMSNEIGPAKSKELLKKELDRTIPKYQEQWDRNLADSYSSLLTQEEMESLTKLKQQSPYVAKFRTVQNQAGANMQTKSKELLTTVISEALNNAFTISMK